MRFYNTLGLHSIWQIRPETTVIGLDVSSPRSPVGEISRPPQVDIPAAIPCTIVESGKTIETRLPFTKERWLYLSRDNSGRFSSVSADRAVAISKSVSGIGRSITSAMKLGETARPDLSFLPNY